jgi:hypothetical protein
LRSSGASLLLSSTASSVFESRADTLTLRRSCEQLPSASSQQLIPSTSCMSSQIDARISTEAMTVMSASNKVCPVPDTEPVAPMVRMPDMPAAQAISSSPGRDVQTPSVPKNGAVPDCTTSVFSDTISNHCCGGLEASVKSPVDALAVSQEPREEHRAELRGEQEQFGHFQNQVDLQNSVISSLEAVGAPSADALSRPADESAGPAACSSVPCSTGKQARKAVVRTGESETREVKVECCDAIVDTSELELLSRLGTPVAAAETPTALSAARQRGGDGASFTVSARPPLLPPQEPLTEAWHGGPALPPQVSQTLPPDEVWRGCRTAPEVFQDDLQRVPPRSIPQPILTAPGCDPGGRHYGLSNVYSDMAPRKSRRMPPFPPLRGGLDRLAFDAGLGWSLEQQRPNSARHHRSFSSPPSNSLHHGRHSPIHFASNFMDIGSGFETNSCPPPHPRQANTASRRNAWEDNVLTRTYEVYRQQQLDLLRTT